MLLWDVLNAERILTAAAPPGVGRAPAAHGGRRAAPPPATLPTSPHADPG